MSIKMSIPKRTIRIATALALVAVMSVVAVSLLMNGTSGVTAFNADASAPALPDIPAQYTAQCSNGTVVLYPANNPGLVADCAALLASKATLEGDGDNLNWSADISIGHWDGIDEIDKLNDDSAHRVLDLDLSWNALRGEIPSELGGLANLTDLDFGYNRLTGTIPSELGNLANLRYLRLAGTLSSERNQFTGCVPASLRDLIDYTQLLAIGLPFCDAASVPSTPVTTPLATSTPTPTPTRAPGITPVATPTPTATSVASSEVINRLTALETQVAELAGVNERVDTLATRVAQLEGGSAIAPPTPTHTPTATPIIIAGFTPSPTPTSVAGVTPSPTATRVAGTSGGNACVTRLAGSASVTGSWSSACLSANSPPNDETYYSRFYTFTLDAAARVTITLSSATAAPYLYLLDGAGTDGAVRLSNGDVATSVAITANLPPGAYTIEASTWYSETYGDFTLELEIR